MWIGSKSSFSSHSSWQNGGRGKAKLQCHWLRQCSAMQFPAILLARAMLGCRPLQCVQCAVRQCAQWIAFEAAVCKSSKQIHQKHMNGEICLFYYIIWTSLTSLAFIAAQQVRGDYRREGT